MPDGADYDGFQSVRSELKLLELTWRLFTDDALLEMIKKDHFDALKEI